ncbi:MAG: hypothetical protein JJU13_10290 [Balneolaceae bacterium]|nr:hypothetical protein [Balneolaceae bacterium]
MSELFYQSIVEDLHELSGSELKAIIAIYSEGGYINSTDMMAITGMARKTCLNVMKSPHIKKAIDRVQNNGTGSNYKEIVNIIRQELHKISEQDEK